MWFSVAIINEVNSEENSNGQEQQFFFYAG